MAGAMLWVYTFGDRVHVRATMLVPGDVHETVWFDRTYELAGPMEQKEMLLEACRRVLLAAGAVPWAESPSTA